MARTYKKITNLATETMKKFLANNAGRDSSKDAPVALLEVGGEFYFAEVGGSNNTLVDLVAYLRDERLDEFCDGHESVIYTAKAYDIIKSYNGDVIEATQEIAENHGLDLAEVDAGIIAYCILSDRLSSELSNLQEEEVTRDDAEALGFDVSDCDRDE